METDSCDMFDARKYWFRASVSWISAIASHRSINANCGESAGTKGRLGFAFSSRFGMNNNIHICRFAFVHIDRWAYGILTNPRNVIKCLFRWPVDGGHSIKSAVCNIIRINRTANKAKQVSLLVSHTHTHPCVHLASRCWGNIVT